MVTYVEQSDIAQGGGALVKNTPILGSVGDSRAAQSYTLTSAGASEAVPSNSPVGWACFYAKQRIHSGRAYNMAVSGSYIGAIGAQMVSLLAVTPRCDYVSCLTGTNSFADEGLTGAQGWAELVTNFLIPARDAGVQAIICLDIPRAIAGAYSTADQQNSLWYNQLIRDNAPAYGAWVLDPTGYLADPASSAGAPRTNYYSDGIHEATLGAERIGYALSNLILSRLPPPTVQGFVNRADVYNATNNPKGNILTNGMFTGTGGANTSNGGVASGTVADSWQNRTLTGIGTSVASIVARAADTNGGSPGSFQQLIWTSAGGVSTYRFDQATAPVVTTNYQLGTPLVMEMDVEVEGAVGLESLDLRITDSGFKSAYYFGPALINVTYYPYPAAFSGRIRTPPLVLNVATASLLVRMEGRVNTGAATVRFGNAELRSTDSL